MKGQVTQGKGKITLDDIAVGVTYNKDPYNSNKKFSVITPDIPSQQKFFTVDNYTHKYLEKEKRSPFVEYTSKKNVNDAYKESLRPMTSRVEGRSNLPAENIENTVELDQQPLTERRPTRERSHIEDDNPNSTYNRRLNHMRSSSHGVKPGTALSGSRTTFKTKRRIHIPKDYAVYNPSELYVPNDEGETAEFQKANAYGGTRYYNMLSLLNLDKTKTLRDVLLKSRESVSSTKEMLRLQKNRLYLTSQGLPPVPKKRLQLEIRGTQVLKNMSKKISNDVHGRITNGGYARTNYGGFFIQ